MKFNFDWEFIHKPKKTTKEYNHEYYLRVTKPKRQKQRELKGENNG